MKENDSDYVVVKALEDGVTVIGVTRGAENKFLHTEKLDDGEVWIAQFTENISAMKIRGKAVIQSKHGEIHSRNRLSFLSVWHSLSLIIRRLATSPFFFLTIFSTSLTTSA